MVQAEGNEDQVIFWAEMLVTIAIVLIVPHLALTAKRFHDIGRSGYFSLLFFIGDIILFIPLCFVPGTPGPNKYGRQPDAPA
jgi:uncharacterized membrane protein YhaH (DUF805 family)